MKYFDTKCESSWKMVGLNIYQEARGEEFSSGDAKIPHFATEFALQGQNI
jgi:hypothetical protein